MWFNGPLINAGAGHFNPDEPGAVLAASCVVAVEGGHQAGSVCQGLGPLA